MAEALLSISAMVVFFGIASGLAKISDGIKGLINTTEGILKNLKNAENVNEAVDTVRKGLRIGKVTVEQAEEAITGIPALVGDEALETGVDATTEKHLWETGGRELDDFGDGHKYYELKNGKIGKCSDPCRVYDDLDEALKAPQTVLGGPSWASWDLLPKVNRRGRIHANINGRLYSEHAVPEDVAKSIGQRTRWYCRSWCAAFCCRRHDPEWHD
ncbi:hypothetical protein ACYFX5_05395 [Bremerella sp. T1]|nr:hypothetical protein [Bremerella volcania]UBM37692.1 hypothetical protein LA756_07335 [Bremerella volcania]